MINDFGWIWTFIHFFFWFLSLLAFTACLMNFILIWNIQAYSENQEKNVWICRWWSFKCPSIWSMKFGFMYLHIAVFFSVSLTSYEKKIFFLSNFCCIIGCKCFKVVKNHTLLNLLYWIWKVSWKIIRYKFST